MQQCANIYFLLTRCKLCVVVWRLFNAVNELESDQDVDLLRDISMGDRSAFARFYDQYSGLLFSIAFKILNDAKEAEDVLRHFSDLPLMVQPRATNPNSRPMAPARKKCGAVG